MSTAAGPILSRKDLLLALVLALAVAAVYLPVLDAGYIWDDDVYLTENSVLREPGGLARIWTDPSATVQYYPLVFTTFWAEYRLWGDAPGGYHAVNVILHLLNALLLWALLRTLGLPGAWLAAALFALHPAQVESVAWITERKNTLSGLFALSSALVFLRFALGAGGIGTGPLIAALLLFAMALLSKTMTISLPAILLLVLWWKRGLPGRRALLSVLPFFALAVLAGAVTLWVERHQVGAAGPAWSLAFPERLVVAGRALWFYAGTLAWPANLTFIYPKWQIDPSSPGQLFYPAAAGLLLALLWLGRGRIGRGPLAAALCFAVALAPVLGFVDFYMMLFSYVADHMLYLAGIAPLAAFAAAAAARARPLRRPLLSALGAALIVACLGFLSWRHVRVFRDHETIWTDTVAKNPGAWLAHYNLGVLLEKRGRPEEAADRYRRAVEINADDEMAHYNLGRILAGLGRDEEAARHFAEVVRIVPGGTVAHKLLADALARLGRPGEALAHYETAIRLQPAYAAAHNNLGALLLRTGRIAEAEARFREALRLDPGYGLARENLERLSAGKPPASGPGPPEVKKSGEGSIIDRNEDAEPAP